MSSLYQGSTENEPADHGGTVTGSNESSKLAIYLCAKFSLITSTAFAGLVLGAIIAWFVPDYFKSSAKISIIPGQNLASLAHFLNSEQENQQQYILELVEKQILEELASPSVFLAFAKENKEEATRFEISQSPIGYFRSVEVSTRKPTRRPDEIGFATFNLTFSTPGQSSHLKYMKGFLRALELKVSQNLIDEIKRSKQLDIAVASANFKAAVSINTKKFNQESYELVEDIKRAKQAGFEGPAFDPKQLIPSDIPLEQYFPRYFSGYRLLAENLKLLEERNKKHTLLPEYLELAQKRNELVVFEESVKARDLDILAYQILPRSSRVSDLVIRLLISLATSVALVTGLIVLLAGRYLSRNLDINS